MLKDRWQFFFWPAQVWNREQLLRLREFDFNCLAPHVKKGYQFRLGHTRYIAFRAGRHAAANQKGYAAGWTHDKLGSVAHTCNFKDPGLFPPQEGQRHGSGGSLQGAIHTQEPVHGVGPCEFFGKCSGFA